MPKQDALRDFKAGVFQALSHSTRIAIVEILRHGELPASTIIEQLELEQANASQHLAVLRSRQLVSSRKEGNQVFYSLRHPLLVDVLDILRRYFEAHLTEQMAVLQGLATSDAQANTSQSGPSVQSRGQSPARTMGKTRGSR